MTSTRQVGGTRMVSLLPLRLAAVGVRIQSVVLGALATCLGAGLSPAQTLIETYKGLGYQDTFGTAADGAGDVDGDGVPDFVVSVPSDSINGTVHVYSGATGGLIMSLDNSPFAYGLGFSVSGAGDLNLDGHSDVIAGSPVSDNATVFSGADGSVMYVWTELDDLDYVGYSINDAGDIDGDGYPDVVVSAPLDDEPNNGFGQGTVQVYSGLTGQLLHEFTGPDHSVGFIDQFGWAVSAAGDVDLDGLADVFAAAWADEALVYSGRTEEVLLGFPTQSEVIGTIYSVSAAGDANEDGVGDLVLGTLGVGVYVYSGADGSIIHQFTGAPSVEYFGARVDGGKDLDGDGVPDIVASGFECNGGQNPCGPDPGYVKGFSGKDGSLLFTITSDAMDDDGFGSGLGIVGDVNGDDRAEIVIGISKSDEGSEDSGRAELWSPLGLAFKSTDHALLLDTGGTQMLRLQAGTQWGGSLYVVIGTATNIVPELSLGGLTLPLVIDDYTLFALGQPNQAPFTGTLGFLGVDGKANAAFVLPPGLDPVLSGLELHHSYVLFGSAGELTYSSNSVPLTIL